MKKKAILPIGSLLVISLLVLLFFSQTRVEPMQMPTAPDTAIALTVSPVDNTHNNLPTGVPDPAPTPVRVIDLAPGIPDDDKVYLYIEHPDGTQDEVRLKRDMSADYLSHLPSGDHLILDLAPRSIVGVQAPDPSARPSR